MARLGLTPKHPQSAGSLRNHGFAKVAKGARPQYAYTGRQRIPLQQSLSAVVASGAATVKLGPMGVGTIWYPRAAIISTTTGATDASTCAVYLSPLQNGATLVPTSQLLAQSYAGGGDVLGISTPPMWPGYFIVAIWAGAVNGDQASLILQGEQDVLIA